MTNRSIYCIFNEIILHVRASLIRTRNWINLCARFRTNAKIFNPDLVSGSYLPIFSSLTLFTRWTTELSSVADDTDFEVLIGSFRTSGADPVSRSHLRRLSLLHGKSLARFRSSAFFFPSVHPTAAVVFLYLSYLSSPSHKLARFSDQKHGKVFIALVLNRGLTFSRWRFITRGLIRAIMKARINPSGI